MQPRNGSIPRRRRAAPGRAAPGRAVPGPAGGASCGRGGSVQHRGERRGPVPPGTARGRPVRLDWARLGCAQHRLGAASTARLG